MIRAVERRTKFFRSDIFVWRRSIILATACRWGEEERKTYFSFLLFDTSSGVVEIFPREKKKFGGFPSIRFCLPVYDRCNELNGSGGMYAVRRKMKHGGDRNKRVLFSPPIIDWLVLCVGSPSASLLRLINAVRGGRDCQSISGFDFEITPTTTFILLLLLFWPGRNTGGGLIP